MVDHLIVYGTLKAGHERHNIMVDEVEFRDEVFLPGELLNYKNMFPVWKLDGTDLIRAELYRIIGDKDGLLETLDEVEGHPYLFERDTFEIQVPANEDEQLDGFEDMAWIIAYGYRGKAPSLLKSPRIPSGNWPLDKGLLK